MPVDELVEGGIRTVSRLSRRALNKRSGKALTKKVVPGTFNDALSKVNPKTRQAIIDARSNNPAAAFDADDVKLMEDFYQTNAGDGEALLRDVENGILNENYGPATKKLTVLADKFKNDEALSWNQRPVQPLDQTQAVSEALPEPPPVHNLTEESKEEWTRKVLAPWVLENQAQIRENELFTNQNIGEIILNNQKKRVSTAGIAKYLDDPSGNKQIHDIKYLKLKDSAVGKVNSRRVAADPMSSPEAVETLANANRAFEAEETFTNRYGEEVRAGVDPQFLNPTTFRKAQMLGANYAREIIRKIANIPELKHLEIQQGHPIDLIANRGTDASAPFLFEGRIGNVAWNQKRYGGTIFSNESMRELNQATGASFEDAAAITSKGPRALQRKAEYEQLGILTEIWNQALIAMETKGEGSKAAITALKKHRNAVRKGDYTGIQSSFKIPGSSVTVDDMLAIQILTLENGDPVKAAQQIIAERELFEWGKANGLVDNPDTFKLLEKYITHINTKVQVTAAEAKGLQKFKEAPLKKPQVLPRGPAQPVNWN